MRKLNFGCGDRFVDGWVNIDFHSSDNRVKRVNLLNGFPYPEEAFDVVYSSHVLEHFTKDQAFFLLKEAHRVLKKGGVLRIVVPDLANTCEEYLRILALPDNDCMKKEMYEWITIELLDQLTRTKAGGEMVQFLQNLNETKNMDLKAYVSTRTRLEFNQSKYKGFWAKLRDLTPQKISTKLVYYYLKCVGKIIPKNLKNMVMIETSIGERHRWMYDFYGLSLLCSEAGFKDCKRFNFDETSIIGFCDDQLDYRADGSSYKMNSVYLEAIRG